MIDASRLNPLDFIKIMNNPLRKTSEMFGVSDNVFFHFNFYKTESSDRFQGYFNPEYYFLTCNFNKSFYYKIKVM